MNLHAQTHTRKGQSAIEYLTTYGWALLAIIVVGAVLVNMGIFDQCQTTQPRFSGSTLDIDSWGWTGSDSMDITFQAINQDINVTTIEWDWNDDGTYEDSHDAAGSGGVAINAGQTGTANVPAGTLSTSTGECAKANLRITYDMQDGSSTGLQLAGSGKLGGSVP